MSTLSMSTIRQRLSGFELSGLGIPFLVLLIMGMLVIPLPPMLLDVLFTFNILVSVIVIMIAIGTRKPLEFSSFPAVLVYAHELVPGRVGLVSGMFFGFAFGLGGLGAALLGYLADLKGIVFVYHITSYLPALGVVVWLLPNVEKDSVQRKG